MAYPSVIATLTNPAATNRLNAPSHSSIHGAVNDEVTQVETFVGTLSSAVGTLVYDIRAAASNGGGHVQTANKGGTGQTAFTKGDLLVAQSSSVLTKLAVSGNTGDILSVDSNQAVGIKWIAAGSANNIYTGSSVVTIAGGQGSVETVLFAASIVGSTLGTVKAIHYTGFIDTFNTLANKTFTIKVKYGNNTVNSFAISAGVTNTQSLSGYFDGFVVNKSVSSQVGNLKGSLGLINSSANTASSIISLYSGLSTASIESSQNQDLIITGQFNDGTQSNSVLTGIFVVEKIA